MRCLSASERDGIISDLEYIVDNKIKCDIEFALDEKGYVSPNLHRLDLNEV